MPAYAMDDVTVTVLDRDLIEAVRRHPDIYRKQHFDHSLTWKKIAEQINSNIQTCRSKWLEILHSYPYIQGIIRDRWELESVLQVHPKTCFYLDGSLKFLDPYVNITRRAPKYILKRHKWMKPYLKAYSDRLIEKDNNLTLVTQPKVQAALAKRSKDNDLDTPNIKYLVEVVGATITQCLMRYKNDKKKCQATGSARKNFNFEINCEDSKMEDPFDEFTVDDYTENASLNVDEIVVLESIAAGSEDISTNEMLTIPSDNFEMKDEELGSENVIEVESEDINESTEYFEMNDEELGSENVIEVESEDVNERTDNFEMKDEEPDSENVIEVESEDINESTDNFEMKDEEPGSENVIEVESEDINESADHFEMNDEEPDSENVIEVESEDINESTDNFEIKDEEQGSENVTEVESEDIYESTDNFEMNDEEPGSKNVTEVESEDITESTDNFEMKDEEPDSEKVTEVESEDINESILKTDIKTFFNDLVDFVSENFTLEKQKKLQRRVTQIVCELYTDNDPE